MVPTSQKLRLSRLYRMQHKNHPSKSMGDCRRPNVMEHTAKSHGSVEH